jgi:hypothetical protein
MSKRTPGPWIFEERVAGFDILAPESVYYVAEYLGVDCGVIDNIADAYLIAAAPELLEALEKIVGLFEPGRIYEFKEIAALGCHRKSKGEGSARC